jgi:hypothetical protein
MIRNTRKTGMQGFDFTKSYTNIFWDWTLPCFVKLLKLTLTRGYPLGLLTFSPAKCPYWTENFSLKHYSIPQSRIIL